MMDGPPSSAGGRSSPPSLRGAPLARQLPALIRSPLDFIAAQRSIHGDIYTLDMRLMRAVLLNHPRHAQHVLVDRADRYKKGGPLGGSIQELCGDGLLVSEGDFWQRQRRMIAPLFHGDLLAGIIDRTMASAREEMARWDEAATAGQPVDLAAELARLTRKAMVRAVFGVALEPAEADRFAEEMKQAIDYTMRGLVVRALPDFLPSPGRRRYKQSLAAIDETLIRTISWRRSSRGSRDDLLSMLVDMTDAETGERMTDEQIRDEIVAIFLASHDTTSAALSWAMHFLSAEPDQGRALRAAVDGVLRGREPSLADLPRLPQTRWILQESLRLYPPAYWLPREALVDDEIDGWIIPKGTIVAPVVYVIHRHPDIWEEPQTFDPGRFSPERSQDRHPLAWLPFGDGPRSCVAKEFAMAEAQLILATIAQRYEVEAIPDRETRISMGTTLRIDGGVWVSLKKR